MSRVYQLIRKMLRIALIGVAIGAFCAISAIGLTVYQVLYGDHTELEKSTILSRIKEETTLFYLDEETHIGSIFESRHRRYIPIDEIPPYLINAIVAAEDKNFYMHWGVDPIAVFKAASDGLLHRGQFRRGGSTITQQTVKNIINDWEASFARKFREMIKAFQLEKLYSKRQILEFYLNQFHVAGNGNGVGIAARYYFNKDIRDISLVEAAFIAGSVKGPGKYNPFIKYTKKGREAATDFANERKNYVLDRMLEQGWISKDEYYEAYHTMIPFNRGEFRTAEVALVSLIRSQLENPEVLKALGLKGIDDLNIAGLKVFTTLDADLQKSAQLAMRRNLCRLESILSGFEAEPSEQYVPLRHLEEETFVYAKVLAKEKSKEGEPIIRVSMGLPEGIIPHQSLVRYAKLLDLPNGLGFQVHLKRLLETIKVGDVLFVEVVQYDHKLNHAVVELQKRPDISGGLIALDKGEVRSVISGFDTLGFNRAIHAARQPGSVFKPLVYFAGLQLGWSMLDRLDNGRQIFPYQGKLYFPRPDHQSPYNNVSMLWAGVLSENLASVSLGAHLLDKVSYEQFLQVLAHFDFRPKPNEAPADYHYRLAKETGVSLDQEGVRQFQLVNAINDIAPDLIFSGQQEILERLRQMWWGNGYLSETDVIRSMEPDPNKFSTTEIQTRLDLVLNNFSRMAKLEGSLRHDWAAIETSVNLQGVQATFNTPSLRAIASRFRVLGGPGQRPELAYFATLAEEEQVFSRFANFLNVANGRELSILDMQAIWGADHGSGTTAANLTVDHVKLLGYLPSEVFARLSNTVEDRYQKAMQDPDPYLTYRYYQHHDFRIGLGLHYLKKLSKAVGIYNPIDPVLSFPLGTSAVTTSEVAKVYQTFIDGKVYRFYEQGPANQINFIRRIEDRYGKVLYEPIVQEHQLVAKEYAMQMREILRKVVTHGTGRRARGELYVTTDTPTSVKQNAKQNDDDKEFNVRVPAFGKTGTTNDFKTSYFAGFLPYPTKFGDSLDPTHSYVISAYVGYDLNQIMRRGRQRIYGGVGALPLWTDFAKEIIKVKDYKKNLDTLDIKVLTNKEWPLRYDSDNSNLLLVDLPRGLILRIGSKSDVEAWQATNYAATGETAQDSFALGSSVQSLVYVPKDAMQQSWQPLRTVQLFNHQPIATEAGHEQHSTVKTQNPSEDDASGSEPLEEEGAFEGMPSPLEAYDLKSDAAQTEPARTARPQKLPPVNENEGIW